MPERMAERMDRMDWVRAGLRVVGISALLALLVFILLGNQHPLEEGVLAPPVKARFLDGHVADVTFANAEGIPTVVNIWATWCPPCLQELPAFAHAARKYEGRVRFVGLAADSQKADVVRLVERFALPYDIAQIGGSTSAAWGATALPSTYIVDGQGRIHWSVRGQIDEKVLSRALDHMLAP